MRPHGHRPRRCLRVRGGEEGRQPGGGPGVEAMAPSKARWLMVSHCPPHAGPPGAQLPGPALGFHGRIPTCRSSPSPSQLCCPGGSRQEMGVSTAQRCGRRPLPSPSPPPPLPPEPGQLLGPHCPHCGDGSPTTGPCRGRLPAGDAQGGSPAAALPSWGRHGGGGAALPTPRHGSTATYDRGNQTHTWHSGTHRDQRAVRNVSPEQRNGSRLHAALKAAVCAVGCQHPGTALPWKALPPELSAEGYSLCSSFFSYPEHKEKARVKFRLTFYVG